MKNNTKSIQNLILASNTQGARQSPEQQNRADKPQPTTNQNLAAVHSTALLGDFSEQARKQSIKELGACWPRLAISALEATKSLHELTLLVSRLQSNPGRVEI